MRTLARRGLGLAAVLAVGLGIYTTVASREVTAKPPGGGGGPCGNCPCVEEIVLGDGTVCWLESCHLLDRKNCLWDCHYVCPFPEP